jgi:hypothetical protein
MCKSATREIHDSVFLQFVTRSPMTNFFKFDFIYFFVSLAWIQCEYLAPSQIVYKSCKTTEKMILVWMHETLSSDNIVVMLSS